MARIMIVDDANLIRRLVRNIVEGMGHEVVGEAVNGLLAIQKYRDTTPDLVTMDVTMKFMDGVSAAREILSFDPGARIIMVTALGQEKMITDAVRAGIKDFVVKPFPDERLKQAIERVLKAS